MRTSVLLAVTATLCPLLACAPPPPVATLAPRSEATATPPSAARVTSEAGTKVLVELSARLAGSWVAKLPNGREIHESYRAISSNSALVESYRAGASETMSVYHADGAHVVLTHYCAQGNQPRLRLGKTDDGVLVFRFLDVTNLLPEKSHLVEKRLAFVGGALDQTEIYEGPDGALETTILHFEREAASS